jgi:iron complex outermembrane recepter protein
MRVVTWCGASVLALSIGLVSAAQAQQPAADANPPFAAANDGSQLNEVLVTAERRSERLQDVPISVTAVSGAALERANVNNVADMERLVPSLLVTQGIGVMIPFLRGVGSLTATAGNEASIPVYVDGVYYARLPQALLEFNNVERVEVLKGPQGTLFGRNATGGLVQIVTRDPSATPAMSLSGGYGSFATTNASFYGTTGVGDKSAVDLAMNFQNQGNGWGTNENTGGDVYRDDHFAARAKWKIDVDPTLSIKFAGDYVHSVTSVGLIGAPYAGTTMGNPSPVLGNAIYPQLPGFYDLRASQNPFEHETSFGGSGHVEKDLGDIKLTDIFAYRRGNTYVYNDTDYVPVDWTDSDNVNSYNQFSEELQLASEGARTIDWVTGLYFLRSTDGATAANFGQSTPGASAHFFGQQTVKSYAAYGQANYHFLDSNTLTLGLRYTYDDLHALGQVNTINGAGTTFGPVTQAAKTFDKLTWKVSLDHKFTDDIMGYLSQSRGYKSGVFPTLLFSPVPVAPEVLDAYEIGIKTEMLDKRLRVNAALFWYNDSGLQISARNGLTVILYNAANSRIRGLDLDSEFLITPGLTATLGLALLDAKYLDFHNMPATLQNTLLPANGIVPGCIAAATSNVNPANGGNVGYCTADGTGNDIAHTPKATITFGLHYDLNTPIGLWEAAADVSYNSGFYWFPDNSLKQPAYTLLSASLRYNLPDNKTWVRFWGRNLTDKQYYLYAQENQGALGYPSAPAEPRTFGATVGIDF